jgi:hypothetical protein
MKDDISEKQRAEAYAIVYEGHDAGVRSHMVVPSFSVIFTRAVLAAVLALIVERDRLAELLRLEHDCYHGGRPEDCDVCAALEGKTT